MSSTLTSLESALEGIRLHILGGRDQTPRTPPVGQLREWENAIEAAMAEILQRSEQDKTTPQAQDAPYPRAREVARLGDMDMTTALRVGLDGDGDVYLSTTDNALGNGIEFCMTGSGGGKSSHTHQALVALMVAMETDNAQDPRRDWWARRNAGNPAD